MHAETELQNQFIKCGPQKHKLILISPNVLILFWYEGKLYAL